MTNAGSVETLVIAGGAGFIGRSVAGHYLSFGHRIIVIDRNEEAALRFKEKNRNVHVIISDLSDPRKSRRTGEEIRESFGGVTHAINLVGGYVPGEEAGIAATSDETMEKCMRLNFTSNLFFLREMLPLIESEKSPNRSVVFVSSINAIQDYGRYIYGACKAGILGIVRSSATELGSKGIRINAILSGTCPNPAKSVPTFDYASLQNETVLNRFASPTEIAQCAYAFTHLMTAVTGQYLAVDCGQTISSDWLRKKYRE
jgi:NAD(P)-dependent dehydrogenase (short-subunit alcohol dehydrogenase family)